MDTSSDVYCKRRAKEAVLTGIKNAEIPFKSRNHLKTTKNNVKKKSHYIHCQLDFDDKNGLKYSDS